VTWNKGEQKWKAHIGVNGVRKFLGYFLTAEEASKAYEAAKLIYHVINSDK
jgi:hypothetical protein